jgi:predicted NAD/FAD-binding protein
LPSSSQRPDSYIISQIVFNPPTYPNFLRFLDLHKRTGAVEVIETEMTFSVSRDGGAFEWAGDGLRSVFCQPRRVFDLGMWRMLFDILRFNACAVRVLVEEDGDLSIGEYLRREGYSSQFKDDYLIVCHRTHPLAVAVVLKCPFFSP